MRTVADLLERLSPVLDLAGSWDPVGLQVGDPDAVVGAIAACHEVSDAVITEAIGVGASLIVAYHPLLFTPVVRFVAGPRPEGRAWRLAGSGVGLVVVHTGWDAAIGGTADALAHALGLEVTGSFAPVSDDSEAAPIGRIGTRSTTVGELAETAADALGATGVRTVGAPGRPVRHVAVLPGSGASFLDAAVDAGADVLVTGDLTHHRAVEARDRGLAVVDVGHAPSERPGMAALVTWLREIDLAPVADLTHIVTDPWEAP